jgi:integrase/recombinase XerC
MTAFEWVEEFKKYMMGVKGASDHTVRSYGGDVELLYRWATTGQHGKPRERKPLEDKPGFDWASFTQDRAVEYMNSLRANGTKASSLQRKLYSLRGFFHFLRRKGVGSIDPFQEMVVKGAHRKPPRILTMEEMGRLLNAIRVDIAAMAGVPSEEVFLTVRDKAMLETMYSAGLRIAEVVGLDWGDINFRGRQARVTGKGSRTRQIPLGQKALDALLVYQRHYEHRWGRKAEGDAPVFLSQNNRRMVTRMINRIVLKWCAAAGIRRINPHMFRHSAAVHMLQGGCDVRVIQAMLGHSSLATTQVYTAIRPRHLQTVHSNTHPRA